MAFRTKATEVRLARARARADRARADREHEPIDWRNDMAEQTVEPEHFHCACVGEDPSRECCHAGCPTTAMSEQTATTDGKTWIPTATARERVENFLRAHEHESNHAFVAFVNIGGHHERGLLVSDLRELIGRAGLASSLLREMRTVVAGVKPQREATREQQEWYAAAIADVLEALAPLDDISEPSR